MFPSFSALLKRAPLTLLRRAGTLLDALAKPPALAFYQSNAQITDAQWAELAKPSLKAALNGYHPSHVTTDAYARCDSDDHLSRVLYADIKTYLPGDILVKVDRMSMAHSLEVRAPLLDYRVMEYAASLKSNYKFRDGEKKYILKQVFLPDLPTSILDRKKMGFSPPLDRWLREDLYELAEALLLNSDAGLIDYFDHSAITKLWRQHQEGWNHGALLWSCVMFQLWWNRYMGPR